MITRFLIFLLLSGSACAQADVWKSTAVWDDAYEARYSKWIEQSFTESFFMEGDWAGIKTDCADAIYASRIVFSYLNGLPFSLGSTEPRFNNASTALDGIQDPVQRVRAFIDLVNERTWTGSLAKHTYPIAISRATVVPGVLWQKPGHVELVSRVRASGVVELRGSWLPGAIRRMITISTLGNIPTNPNVGFRRWIWPQNFDVPKNTLSGYDESQIHPPTPQTATDLQRYTEIGQFEEEVRAKMARSGQTETSKMRIARLASDYCTLIHARSEVVELGHDYVEQAARCLNEKEYYAYSTPGRDSNLRRVVYGLGLELKNDLNRVAAVVKKCPSIPLSESQTVAPYVFLRKLLKLEFSSDPHQSPAARFGVAAPEPICVGPDSGETDSGS